METQAIGMLDIYLSTFGYCREGYWLLERNINHQRISLRGECNELASETDREKYPNTRSDVIRESTLPDFISLPQE